MAKFPPAKLREALALVPSKFALAMIPALQRLPEPLLGPLGKAIGALAFYIWKRPRKVAMDNLSHAFPEWTTGAVRAHTLRTFHNWGVFTLQWMRLSRLTEKDWNERVIVEGQEHVFAGLERGKGVLLCSGHLGCFEMGAAYAAYRGQPVSAIARYAKTSAITDRMNAIRESAGYKILLYDARGFRAMKNLRANELVFILIDQDEGAKGVFVDFFGRPASTVSGPAVLAARTGATLLTAWVVREKDGRFRLICEPALPNPGPDASPEAIREVVQLYTRRLEAIVRQYPDQYLWMHRRWKTKPRPEAE